MKFKNISKLLAIGILFNSFNLNSFASVLSGDTRYETFKDNNIAIPDVLEEDKIDIKVEGNTLVNNCLNSTKNGVLINGITRFDSSMIKPNTEYTLIFEVPENNLKDGDKFIIELHPHNGGAKAYINVGETGKFIKKVTTYDVVNLIPWTTSERSNVILKNLMVLEGDWTNKEIPEYFEGVKSSFEDQLVTQEMVDSGEEKAENLGKYKVEYKITGKNKININDLYDKNNLITDYATYGFYIYPLRVEKNKEYFISVGSDNLISNNEGVVPYLYIGDNVDYNKCVSRLWINHGDLGFRKEGKIIASEEYIYVYLSSNMDYVTYILDNIGYLQIEEGSAATSYEPYKEFINTFYLNSPLLEGDTIEYINGQAYHIHRYREIVLDGNENWAYNVSTDNTYNWYSGVIANEVKPFGYILSDTLSFNNERSHSKKGIHVSTAKNINITLLKIDVESNSVNSLKSYLKSNPIRAVYELNEPIYEPIKADLSVQLFEGTTHISNNSNIPANMEITVDRVLNRAVEAIELAKANPTTENLSRARMWVNLASESVKKDELQSEINNITNIDDLQLERKTVTSNLDVYVKSENMLSLSLNTNSIIFDGYSGVEDMEMLGAVNISVNSSLPYDLNAYLPSEIANADKSEIMDIEILKIKESSNVDYQNFDNTTDKIVLKDGCNAGNNLIHNIDLKLASNQAHKADVYKTVIKFEAEQK